MLVPPHAGAVGAGGGGSAGLTGMVQNISITLLPSSYSVYDQAKFFAKLGAAFYDGTITVWWVKTTAVAFASTIARHSAAISAVGRERWY